MVGLVASTALQGPVALQHGLPGLLAWPIAGLALYRFGRLAGNSADAAVAAAWCALVATPVIAGAVTTGAGLPAGAALIASAAFALDWRKRSRIASGVFSGLLAGLSLGSSPYALWAVIAASPVLWATRGRWTSLTGWKFTLLGLALGLGPCLLILATGPSHAVQQSIARGFASDASGFTLSALITVGAAGPGLAGLLCLGAAVAGLRHPGVRGNDTTALAMMALAWLASSLVAWLWLPGGQLEMAPVIVLAAPSLAALLDRLTIGRISRTLAGVLLALATLWSAVTFIRRATSPALGSQPEFAVAAGTLSGSYPAAKGTPANRKPAPRLLFSTDLVADTSASPVLFASGLLSPEPASLLFNSPRIREMRASPIRIVIPTTRGMTRLRITLSARVQWNSRGILELHANGRMVRPITFTDTANWHEEIFDLPARDGENVVELRNAPLPQEPDLLDYLDRYPDVRLHLEMIRQPLLQGAREHYEHSGRAEGRTVRLLAPAQPAPDDLLYIFRTLRVEGLAP